MKTKDILKPGNNENKYLPDLKNYFIFQRSAKEEEKSGTEVLSWEEAWGVEQGARSKEHMAASFEFLQCVISEEGFHLYDCSHVELAQPVPLI